MRAPDDSLVGRLDRLGVERLARAAGLPDALASHVSEVVTGTGLREDRRVEVFRELVAHFQDGLEAGRTPEELLHASGTPGVAARLIHEQKRIVTPEAQGGTGSGDGLVTRVARDARYAIRRLLARPAFTATAILSLALGIGANAAMFTLVNDLILRKPAFEAPDRLVEIYMAGFGGAYNTMAYPDLKDVEAATGDVFSAVAGMRLYMVPRSDGGALEQVTIEMVTANYFEVLGLRPGLGRLIERSDAPVAGSGDVVVLTDAYWRRAFRRDPGVVGKTIRLSSAPYTIVGIAPPDYPGALRGIGIDLFVPITMHGQLTPNEVEPLNQRGNYFMFGKARLRPGVGLEQARVTMDRVAQDLIARRAGGWQPGDGFTLLPFTDVIIYPSVDKVLVPIAWMLMVVVGLVLMIACANLASFLLARAVDRRKEIAVRLALGAGRGQLVTQFLVETVILAVLGGAAGLALARAVLRAVLAADLPLPMQVSVGLALDWRVLTFSTAVSVAAGLLFGLVPALQATRFELASVIRDESGGGARTRGRLRQVLVAAQVAVSVVLLIAAGLFVRSLDAARSTDPGFGRGEIALAWISSRIPVDSSVPVRVLRQRIAEMPGVERVGMTDNIPLNILSTSSTSLIIDGVPDPPGRLGHEVDRAAVDTGFFDAAGFRLLAGRNFSAADVDGAPAVAIVNQAFVDRYWPGREPLGGHFRMRGGRVNATEGRQFEVVGVVNTAKIRSLGEDPRPMFYVPMEQWHPRDAWLVARTHGDAGQLVAAMRREIASVEPDVFYFQSRTMARHLQIMSLPIKLGALALAAFAGLALLMASTGLYGTVSYSVAQRTREVGIRLALGARQSSVVSLLLLGGLRTVLAGAVVGLIAALYLARLLQGLLFGIKALDPLTFVAVPAVLLSVAFLAAWLPARRAGRVDPQTALRSE